MRDMMAQIRDVGDGVRDGTYTMTAPKITGGTITGVTLTGNTLTNPVITGATLTTSAFNGTVGATTASTGAFTTLSTSSTTTFSGLTASTALALDASKNVVSVTNTGTGNNVLSASPTLTGTIAGASLSLSSLTSGRVTYAGASGLLSDSANFLFTSNGDLLVGGSSNPRSARIVSENASGQQLGLRYSGVATWYQNVTSAGDLYWDKDASEKMRITSAGNVGIGTSSASYTLDVLNNASATLTTRIKNSNASGLSGILFDNNSSTAGASVAFNSSTNLFEFWTNSDNGFRWGYAGSSSSFTERMRIDSSGNLLVGTTSATQGGASVFGCFSSDLTSKYGVSVVSTQTTGTGSMMQFVFNTTQVGSIAANSVLTAYNTTSDYRLKENIVPMTGALAKVAQLKPVTYKWKVNGSDGQGFIAHELAEVVPDCVTGEKDAVNSDGKPVYQGIDTSQLVATLVSAIQEQQALIESLTTRLTALESK